MTIEALKAPSAPAYSFSTQRDFSRLFELIESRARQCFSGDFVGRQGQVNSRIDRTARTAEVTYSSPDLFGQLYLLRVEIAESATNTSNVRVAYHSPWLSAAWAVRRWVEEDYLMCSTHKPDSDGQGTAVLTERFSFSTRGDFLTTYGIITRGLRNCHDARLIRGSGHVDAILEQKSAKEPQPSRTAEAYPRRSTICAQWYRRPLQKALT